MNLTAYCIDDENHALQVLSGYIERTPGLSLLGSSTDPLLGLAELSALEAPPDIIFLDVDMPELNGLQLARLLNAQSHLIITTSYREYGPEAYELSATDYLLKPIAYERFMAAVQKARLNHSAASARPEAPALSFFVKTGTKGHLQKIVPAEVSFIEAASNYMHIHTPAGRIITYMNISELLALLPPTDFVRVHKSFVVNLQAVHSFDQAYITLNSLAVVPIGRAYRPGFMARLVGLPPGTLR